MQAPIVLLAFANQIDSPLPSLQGEFEALNASFAPSVANGKLNILPYPSTSGARLVEALHDFSDRLTLFHFSGHANTRLLETLDVPVHGIGVARLLGRAPLLRCVMLNGCSTYGQVEALLLAGVPVVIATTGEVEDSKAGTFSKVFYQELNQGASLLSAFDVGMDAYQALGGPQQVHRGVYSDFGKSDKETPMLGIYCRQNTDMDWRLEEADPVPEYQPNVLLISKLAKIFARPGSELQRHQDTISNGGGVAPQTLRGAIYRACPHPIYDQLRLLMQSTDPAGTNFGEAGFEMLKRIAVNYATTVRFITLVMLARLWEVLLLPEGNKEVELTAELKQRLAAYLFNPNRDKFESLTLVQQIRQFFDDQNLNYFVEDLSGLREKYQPGNTFYSACEYLENLNTNVELWETDRDLKRKSAFFKIECREAEKQLAAFFEPLAFIGRYELRSIYDINLAHSRTQRKILYRHHFVNLAGGDENGPGSDVLEGHSDPASVALIRGEFRELKFLNLSPFIIDKNTFLARDPKKMGNSFNLLFFDNVNQAHEISFSNVYNPDDQKFKIGSSENLPYAKEFRQVFDQFQALLDKISN